MNRNNAKDIERSANEMAGKLASKPIKELITAIVTRDLEKARSCLDENDIAK